MVVMQNGSAVFAPNRERMIFDYAQAQAAKGRGIIVQPGFIRSEVLLATGTNRYDFNVLKNNNTDLVTESKIDPNDSFIVSKLGIYILPFDTTSPLGLGAGVLQTYPNASAFATAITNGVTQGSLEAVYNGKLYVAVQNTIYLPAWDVQRCRVVRTTLQTSATNYSERLPDDGLDDPGMIITLNGDAKTVVSLTIPTWAGQVLTPAAGTQSVKAIFYARGYTLSGGSNQGQGAMPRG